MVQNSRETERRLSCSPFINKLNRIYPIYVFTAPNDSNTIIVRIELRDRAARLVDVLDLEINKEGFLRAEAALNFVVLAFEMGLDHRSRESAWRFSRETQL